jgi:D-amino-acid dehydrogenase
VPLVAERGYHIEGEAGDWPKHLPPVVFEDRSMIVTRFGGRLRAASFTEFARPSSPPDIKKWERLHRHASELGLHLGEPLTQWMGARPTLPDYLPAIGVSRRADNLIYAFGHQHLGLTLAATTGEIVAELATGGRPATDIQPFDIERFAFRRPHSNLGQQ